MRGALNQGRGKELRVREELGDVGSYRFGGLYTCPTRDMDLKCSHRGYHPRYGGTWGGLFYDTQVEGCQGSGPLPRRTGLGGVGALRTRGRWGLTPRKLGRPAPSLHG